MVKRILVFSLLLFQLILTGGCWNRLEPEHYAWLSWLGLDKAEGGKVKIMTVVSPPLSPVPTGAAPPEDLMLTSSATGDTVFDAVRNINAHLPKRLFWPYLQAVVLSEDIARSGVEQHLDALFRNVRVRKNAWVFITRGPVDSVFKIDPQIERSPAALIDALVKAEQDFLGKSRVLRLKEFQRELASPGFDPVVSVLGVWDPKEEKVLPPGAKVPKKAELALDGSAVFQGDKLVGWLSPAESQAYLLGKGEMKTGLIAVPHPDNPQNLAGIEIIRSSSKLRAEIAGGRAVAKIEVKISANLGDQRFNAPGREAEDTDEDPDFYLKLGEQLERKVKSDLEKLAAKSQTTFDADIFGIGDYIANRYPNDWEQIQSNWRDYYKQAAIEIEVKANIAAANIMRSHPPRTDNQEQSGSAAGEE